MGGKKTTADCSCCEPCWMSSFSLPTPHWPDLIISQKSYRALEHPLKTTGSLVLYSGKHDAETLDIHKRKGNGQGIFPVKANCLEQVNNAVNDSRILFPTSPSPRVRLCIDDVTSLLLLPRENTRRPQRSKYRCWGLRGEAWRQRVSKLIKFF